MQSTSLKFEIIWILQLEVWQIRFYTLKFGLLAKLHPLLVLGVKWHADILMCIFFFYLPNQPKKRCHFGSTNNALYFKWERHHFGRLIWQNKTKNTHQHVSMSLNYQTSRCKIQTTPIFRGVFCNLPKKNLKDLRKANLNLLANNNNFTQTQYSTSH